MSKKSKGRERSLDEIRAMLLNGRSPRKIGGEDARANRPPVSGIYLPAFLREIRSRCDELCHFRFENVEEGFVDIATALRASPYALSSPHAQLEGVVESAGAQIDTEFTQQTADIV